MPIGDSGTDRLVLELGFGFCGSAGLGRPQLLLFRPSSPVSIILLYRQFLTTRLVVIFISFPFAIFFVDFP
jgi:hypothetical protein